MKPVVEAIGLSRTVDGDNGPQQLLQDVSFTLHAKERVGLIGASGAGKSLLMRSLCLLDPIDVGEVRWKGEVVTNNQIPEFRRNVCYLPQKTASFEGAVRERLMAPFTLATWRHLEYSEDLVVQWLDLLKRGVSFLDKSGQDLSGGENQIVRLLRALLAQPTVLLLDEPTSAMDSDTTLLAEQLITDWSQQSGNAFLWCSHSSQQIARVADRCLTMANGRLIKDEPTQGILGDS